MVLLALPSKGHSKEELLLAKSVLEALKPDVVVSDGVSPWSRTLAYASFDFSTRLHIVQPWKRPVDPIIAKHASSTSVFNTSPSKFFLDDERYFAWLRANCTHLSKLKDEDSSFTHVYLVRLEGLKIYEHER